jgi:hypothetical protein
MTMRHRKFLWVLGVPLLFVGLVFLPSVQGIAILVVAVASCVVAMSHRPPRKQAGIRLLMDEGDRIDTFLVKDTGAITQIVLVQGERRVSLIEVEDRARTDEALDVLRAHAPHAAFEYLPPDGETFTFADFRFWDRV